MISRNISNMITSIISSVIVLVFCPLEIIKQAHNLGTIGVTFISIIFPVMLVYFIIRSVYFGISSDVGKNVLYRICKVFLDIFVGLITIFFLLLTTGVLKWIFLGVICLFIVISIFFDIFYKFSLFKYILYGIEALLLMYCILSIYNFNILVFMSVISIIVFYIGNVFGKVNNNKILLSSDIISLLLFNLFLLLI